MTKNYNDLGVEFKYLIVNDMDRKFGLCVNTVGFQSIKPNSPYPLKDHPTGYFFNAKKGRILREYQLVYITKGRGLFTSETTPEKQVCKGRLMMLFPGQWHTYYPFMQTGWNEYYIGFEGTIIDHIIKGSFLTKENQILEVGLNEELVNLFSRALEIAESDKISAQQYLSGIVLHMIGMILSISKNKIYEIGDVDQKIEQAKIIMNENVFKNIDPEELAMKLNISYSWFRKVFKDYTGYAPAKYFQELKLRKAKQLLVGTSHSVKEISFMLDYKSTEHFFSLFKKRTGFTPLEYRSYGRETNAEEGEG
ncbi:MAG: AraC family transcriptional regulator [Bacteroides sp.]|nr:AraC family transcriptional regulator [Bacteroides sp.]